MPFELSRLFDSSRFKELVVDCHDLVLRHGVDLLPPFISGICRRNAFAHLLIGHGSSLEYRRYENSNEASDPQADDDLHEDPDPPGEEPHRQDRQDEYDSVPYSIAHSTPHRFLPLP